METNRDDDDHIISPRLLISSALAGSLARIPTHPLDTLKARLMSTTTTSHVTLVNVIKKTWRHEGIKGFYRGFMFSTVASLPASCLYFSSQELSRQYVFNSGLLSGFFAETVACLLYVPIDVVKERLQVQTIDEQTKQYGAKYSSGTKAIQNILKTEGISGLYKGYFSTLASFGPFSALYFYFYEGYRYRVVSHYKQTPIPAYAFWLGGGVCGAAAAFLTSPLDLIKLRKQLDPTSPSYFSKGMISGLLRTLREEGLQGSFRGATARVLFFSPTTAFSMAIFEVLKGSS
jgi:hypothetical protein